MTQGDVEDRMTEAGATYRCVCGNSLRVLDGESIRCESCERQYDREFLNNAGADTISIDSDLVPARLITRPENDPLIGDRLGHFKILGRIGNGGMGAVYHALDESLQRYVALKVIHHVSEGAETEELDRLFQEARAQARVSHPSVVHVYFVGLENKLPFLAMELVGGGTLAERMQEDPIPFREIVDIAIQVNSALACAAQYDIVHGDIKPSNVLMSEHTAKLSDFGLARRLSAGDSTSSGLSGTPDYMPPESTRGGTVDHRGDMYSLGVTLFQITFGRLPYSDGESTDLSDRLRQHREADVQFPEWWPPEVPEGWRAVLERLLQKDPEDRYADFAELEQHLEKMLPMDVPAANPLLRGLAWMLDCVVIATGLIIIQVFSALANAWIGSSQSAVPELGIVGSLLSFVVACGFLCAIGLTQAQWGNTTGKRFLQILIVDQHGLRPRRRVLAMRSVFQFSWAWWLALSGPMAVFGMWGLAATLGWVVGALLLTEIGLVMFRNGRSLHDTIFATRVVLDVSSD